MMQLRQLPVQSRSSSAAVAATVPPSLAVSRRSGSASCSCRHPADAARNSSSSSSSSSRRLLPTARSGASGVDLSALGIEVPAIDAADIASYQQELGAEFDDSGVAVTFNNTERVLEALSHGVALVDRCHWGRLRVAGGDRLALLHNQSTADFKQLQAGQGCDTVRAGLRHGAGQRAGSLLGPGHCAGAGQQRDAAGVASHEAAAAAALGQVHIPG
ncbi:hypothetical protein COO60DRAFT_990552 [Scenedesmus sp. NREL 46B-D3]|nr:hypothetical protein COO60DRAFT_990552 [Scenedesmus sp. NREL 46B-D3]